MPSPFPGMDPFLEDAAFWPDFHATFIVAWREALRAVLPPQYEPRIGERIYLVEPPHSPRRLDPDVAVSRSPDSTPAAAPPSTAGAALAEPVIVPLALLDRQRETYIEVLRRPNRTLVAVLELLSPWNKREPGYGEYVAKRDALLRQEVHLVELDLLIGGHRLPMAGPLPGGDYYAFVARADRRPDCQVYAWSIRRPLPVIPIPLRAPDADAPLDLAAVFASAFERGFYNQSMEYGRQLPRQLNEPDRKWAAALATGAAGAPPDVTGSAE